MHNLENKLESISSKIKELEALSKRTSFQDAKLYSLHNIRKELELHIDNRIKEMLEIIGDC